jgi:hypothetical protein
MSVSHAKKRKTRAFGRRRGGRPPRVAAGGVAGWQGGEQGCSVCKFGPTRRFRAVRGLAFQFCTSSTRPPWKRAREPLSARTTVGAKLRRARHQSTPDGAKRLRPRGVHARAHIGIERPCPKPKQRVVIIVRGNRPLSSRPQGRHEAEQEEEEEEEGR